MKTRGATANKAQGVATPAYKHPRTIILMDHEYRRGFCEGQQKIMSDFIDYMKRNMPTGAQQT